MIGIRGSHGDAGKSFSIGGINCKNNHAFAKKLCVFLKEELGIEPGRVYINFVDVDASNWGWNGERSSDFYVLRPKPGLIFRFCHEGYCYRVRETMLFLW